MLTVNSAFAELQRLSIGTEVTRRRRGRVYSYKEFVDILSDGAAAMARFYPKISSQRLGSR